MKYAYPKPQDVGISIPFNLIEKKYCSGFLHALKGGSLSKIEYLKQSFGEGFRAGKLYLRELRRKQGVVNFPVQGKIKFRAF
jgi:hypothetical protein